VGVEILSRFFNVLDAFFDVSGSDFDGPVPLFVESRTLRARNATLSLTRPVTLSLFQIAT